MQARARTLEESAVGLDADAEAMRRQTSLHLDLPFFWAVHFKSYARRGAGGTGWYSGRVGGGTEISENL